MEFWGSVLGIAVGALTVLGIFSKFIFSVIKGKIMSAVSNLIEKKISFFDRSKESERVQRQEKYMVCIQNIKDSIARQEKSSREHNTTLMENLKSIEAQINSHTDKIIKNTQDIAVHKEKFDNLKGK